MSRLRRGLAGMLVILLGTGAAIGAPAQMGASVSAPLRHEIADRCVPLEAAAQRSNLMYARYTTSSGPQDHAWQVYSVFPPKSPAANDDAGDDATGTFVHVLSRGAAIDAAYFFTPETQRAGETTTWYCYLHGRLARMRTKFTLMPAAVEWIRTKYYGDDGVYLTQTDTHRHLIAGDTSASGTPPPDERVFLTPAALPFYAVFRNHHRG